MSAHRVKCAACGLVNFATNDTCRRCDRVLVARTPDESLATEAGGRSFGRWLLWIAGVTIAILTTAYASLLVTSDGMTDEQQEVVLDAIGVVEDAGFSREAFLLRHVVSYRSTPNWWNRYVGHQTAYAATNYPFAVVTLYPAFFRFPTDEVERAAILLHEAHHVVGADEPTALRRVWQEKQRLGWVGADYAHTRVWKNTREWTSASSPALFQCGVDHQSDCIQ